MKEIIKINLLNYIVLIFFEAMFALISFDIYSKGEVLSILIYSLFVSFVMTILMTIWSEKVNRIFGYIIYFIFCFWFALETIFKAFLQTFFSLDCFKLSDQAMGFAGETIKVIVSNIHYLILFFLPFILLIIFRRKLDFDIKGNKKYLFGYIILIPLSFLSYRLYINSTKNSSDISLYDLYYNTNNIPLSIQKMGVLSSTGLDIYRNIFGFDDKVIEVNYEENDDNDELFVYDKNILDLNLDSDKLNKDIKKYIEDNPGTSKNKYSGMFENKNLIFVVAESYSEIGVDEERTPTLYKLTHNGFIFNNFYVPYYLSTIGGEFQSLTGLYPNYSTLTKWKSGENSFPYGLATTFKEKGYNTYAYHAHDGYFQNRYKYLKALGFDNFKACNMGLNINCNMWPESDIEMIKATTNDYINSDKPFMTYYMTVSGHLDYTKEGNSIVSKNWDLVKNLDYSDKAKSYLATQIELDRAMESLLKELENKGILEDTVIVLLADHYPYGLSLEEINELSSYKRDELFEINHNALIIYNSSMKNINITKVGMPIDVLPTIYNLFDIKYDSRLFAGSDLLSNSEGMVILDNLSWITDSGRYNSLNGKYNGDIDSDYISNINNNTKYINLSIDSFNSDVINYFLEYGKGYSYTDTINNKNGFIYATYSMFKNSENIINGIINNIPSNLSNIEKVRYLYIALGKILSADINTMDNKNEKISFSSVSIINNIWGSITSGKTTSACISKLLMYLCSRIGIKSELINSDINGNIGNKIYVDDSFLIVDLYNDLYNIQGGFSTKYFDKYNDNKDIDKKIFYIKNSYINEIIDKELRGLDYTKDNMLSDILEVLERSINISDVGVIELAKICKDIFDKYTPNYDIRINNLFLLDSDESKEHFIVISYDNSFYSYNYNKQCFIKMSYDVITKNIKDNKIGIYKGEDFYCKESRLVL